MKVKVQFYDDKPLSASVPKRVTCTVKEAIAATTRYIALAIIALTKVLHLDLVINYILSLNLWYFSACLILDFWGDADSLICVWLFFCFCFIRNLFIVDESG